MDPKRNLDDPVNLPEDPEGVLGALLNVDPDAEAAEDEDGD